MEKQSFLILISIVIFVNLISIQAAPGDSVAEAFTAQIGENQGTLDAYNDIEYYNFTGETFRAYNFTLVPDPVNYNTMRIYDVQFNLIAENFTGTGSKFLILSGYETYIIGIYASEFMENIPGDYSLYISEFDVQEIIGSSQPVSIGNTDGKLDLYNDVDWYNFTGSAANEYNFQVSHLASYVGLLIYDADLKILDGNWTTGTINSVNQTGNSLYVIAVVSSEFAELPLDYTLTISDLTLEELSTSVTSTTNTVTSTSNTFTSTSNANENPSITDTGGLAVNWFSVALVVAILPLIRKRK